MREKHLGIWRAITLARVRRAGAAAWGSGWWRSGSGPATWSRSSPTTARSGSTPISASCRWAASPTASTPPTPPRQVEYIVNDSGTRFFFAENEEQLDKILEVRGRCPQLVKIFVFDMEGLHGFQDEQVMPFDGAARAGRRATTASIPAPSTGWSRSPGPRTWPSSSTPPAPPGPPKGAMLSHRNILFQLELRRLHHRAARGRPAALLPAAVPRRRADVHASSTRCDTGATVNFAESIDTVPENIREVAPAAVLRGAADLGEVLLRRGAAHAGGHAGSAGSPTDWAIGVGMRVAERRIAGRRPSLGPAAAATGSADFLVLDNVKRSIGPAPGARRRHRRGAHRPRPDPVVPGARHRHARGLRPDRELRPRHGHAAPTASSSARWAWPGRTPRCALSPAGRDPPEGPARLPRLLRASPTRPRRRSSTAGCTPATWAPSTPTASCASPTA